jgi:putative tricarboxylic transport membrane protein
VGFGIFGWILRKHNYPVAPIILGIVLGNIAETNFRRAVMMGGYNIFLIRPLSLILLALALLSFAMPLLQQKFKKKISNKDKNN